MIVVAIVIAVLAVVAAALAAALVHVLRRDRGLIWRPGDPLPEIPADAALRHWHA